MPRNYVNKILFSAMIKNWQFPILPGTLKYQKRNACLSSPFFCLKKLVSMIYSTLDRRDSKYQLHCLQDTHTLVILIKHADTAAFPHCCFLFGSQETDLCLTTLRSGALCLGEKCHWSPFQVPSRAGGNDFRPKNLYF